MTSLPVRKHGTLYCPDFPPKGLADLERRSDAQEFKEHYRNCGFLARKAFNAADG